MIYLTCRYKLGSPSFKGGSAEISVKFWWSFPEAGPIPGTVLSLKVDFLLGLNFCFDFGIVV